MKEEAEKAVETAKGLLQDFVVVVSLVRTLTESFGSASDLYRKLKRRSGKKDSDDEEDEYHTLRPWHRRRRDSMFGSEKRKGDYSDSEEELICTSSSQIRAEYERGYRKLGEPFARGDVTTHTQLQSQIIKLQQTVINIQQDLLLSTYMAPSSSHSHLVRLIQTARTARAASIASLNMQYERMLPPLPSPLLPRQPDAPLRVPGAFPLPDHPRPPSRPLRHKKRMNSSSSSSCESKEVLIKPIPIVKPKPKPTPIPPPPPPPQPQPPSSRYSTRLFCIYAKDLQHNSRLHLADTYRPTGDHKCPFCRTHVPIQPGKAWELVVDGYKKKDEHSHFKMAPRTFRIKNRFIVKSHREGGGFACVLCARFRESDTVCRGIEALMDHLWREHTSYELEMDADIVEV
ncbi:hypothetical protein J4E91_000668 [Alternaria rosae]|uniref:uncharacterized protein n=1 Tax=Alternaria rosae TaxID=1187941 RepID=UPI001E8CD8E4|nr:uncharacterized protein BKA58DRAFT_375787 [Alternaria rosae]KAH6877711.1 hypothetical protein BKA58DRAFT_375787 [Alternaria rosae]KAI4956457.1 hypothetical protein J4E91_000668 [Alternaria rosae]